MADTVTAMIAQPVENTAVRTATITDQDTSTTIAAGSNGVDLATNPGTINVVNASGFSVASVPVPRTITVTTGAGPQVVTYTGKTGTSFTGVVGGTGVMSTGGAVVGARIVSFAAQWYIIGLGLIAATGTSDEDAIPLGPYVQTQVRGSNSRWTLTLRATGLYDWTYSGTGTGTIIWTTSSQIRATLGFSSTIVATSGGGAVVASFPPTHVIYTHYRPVASDSDIQTMPVFAARSKMRSGKVDVLKASTVSVSRTFGIADHPRTPADALVRGTVITPIYPDENNHSQWNSPSGDMDTAPGLWTVHRQVHSGEGLRMSYTLGKFQQIVAGSVAYFDLGYWAPSTANSKVAVFAPPLITMSKRDGLELTRLATSGGF